MTCPDYVTSGFAASLARPGGNITGTSIISPEINPKRIQLLLEIAPKMRRLAIVTVAGLIGPSVPLQISEIEQLATKFGLESRVFTNAGPSSFEQLAVDIRVWRADGVILIEAFRNALHRQELVEFGTRLKVPVVGGDPRYAQAGALLSYGANSTENYRRSAYFIDRILKGAKPADLPI